MLRLPLGEHLLDHLALQVGLGAAQVAGDDREGHAPGELGDVRLAAVGERPDHHVAAVVGEQLGRHRLEAAGEEEVEEQRLEDVLAMVPQGDLVGADLLGEAVEGAAPQPRAERAGGLALGGLLLDHRVGVALEDMVLDADTVQVLGQYVLGEARLLLVKVDRHQREVHRGVALQAAQDLQQGVAVLAAGEAHHHPVAIVDHAVVDDGVAHLAPQALLQLVELAYLPGVRGLGGRLLVGGGGGGRRGSPLMLAGIEGHGVLHGSWRCQCGRKWRGRHPTIGGAPRRRRRSGQLVAGLEAALQAQEYQRGSHRVA